MVNIKKKSYNIGLNTGVGRFSILAGPRFRILGGGGGGGGGGREEGATRGQIFSRQMTS